MKCVASKVFNVLTIKTVCKILNFVIAYDLQSTFSLFMWIKYSKRFCESLLYLSS